MRAGNKAIRSSEQPNVKVPPFTLPTDESNCSASAVSGCDHGEVMFGMRLGRLASFPEIAEREGQCERHIRLLAPLAFVSPRIVAAIANGAAPAPLTVTGLAKALPYSWAEQERDNGLVRCDSANA